MRPSLEVADIVRAHGDEFRQAHAASLSTRQKRVLRSIELCRTAALGGHLERCDQCGHERNAYNSCADRHCPRCQSLARAKWLEKRQAEPAKPTADVQSALPSDRRDFADDRCRSEAPGRANRLFLRSPHLGADAYRSSPSALRRAGGRYCLGWPALDRLPTGVLLASEGTVPSISKALSPLFRTRPCSRKAAVLR